MRNLRPCCPKRSVKWQTDCLTSTNTDANGFKILDRDRRARCCTWFGVAGDRCSSCWAVKSSEACEGWQTSWNDDHNEVIWRGKQTKAMRAGSAHDARLLANQWLVYGCEASPPKLAGDSSGHVKAEAPKTTQAKTATANGLTSWRCCKKN